MSGLQNQEVTEGDTVCMSCTVSEEGHVAQWFKEKQEIDKTLSDKYQTDVDGGLFTLTIPKSTVSDSAEYTIKIGDVETSAKLVVNGESIFN